MATQRSLSIDGHGGQMAYPPNQRIDKLDDDTAFALLMQRSSVGRTGRDPVHLSLQKLWYECIAYYVGIQDPDSPDLFLDFDRHATSSESGYIANHIYRLVLSNVARKSQASPAWDVIPNSPDHVDQEAAKVAKHLLDYVYREKGLRTQRRELSFWTEMCGTAFQYVNWRTDAGKVMRVYKDLLDGTPVSTRDLTAEEMSVLQEFESFDEKSEGDLELEVLSGFNVRLPHEFVKLDMMPWVLIERLLPLDWVWEHYPDKAAEIMPEDLNTVEDEEYLGRLSNIMARKGTTISSRASSENEVVRVSEMWIRPYGRFRKGCLVIGTKTALLENGPHPFKEAGLDIPFPIVDFHHARVPGRFWSMGTVEHLLGPQREYNRGRTQLILQRDTLSHPQWLAPHNAEIDSTRNDYGDWITYNPTAGAKPELQNPPTLSQVHVETNAAAISDMQTIAAQSDPSQGKVPSGVRSGVAIRALQEKDMLVAGPTIEDMEDGYQKVGGQVLKLYWKFASVPRTVQIYGEQRSTDVQTFKGADLMGNTTVRVRAGSMMPKSRAATESTLMDLLQLGGLNPAMVPADKRILFEALEVGDIDSIFLHENLQRRRAKKENMMFYRPAPGPWTAMPDVQEFDDHQAHYEEHVAFALTDAWEHLPPVRKLMFLAHIDKHLLAVSRMMEAQMTFQALGAGPSGGGSPPAQRGNPSPTRERQPTPGTEGAAA